MNINAVAITDAVALLAEFSWQVAGGRPLSPVRRVRVRRTLGARPIRVSRRPAATAAGCPGASHAGSIVEPVHHFHRGGHCADRPADRHGPSVEILAAMPAAGAWPAGLRG